MRPKDAVYAIRGMQNAIEDWYGPEKLDEFQTAIAVLDHVVRNQRHAVRFDNATAVTKSEFIRFIEDSLT